MILVKILRAISDVLMKIMRWFGIISIFVMIIAIVYQIISRFAGISATWTEELARFLMIWVCFLASAYIYNDPSLGAHVRIDALTSHFSPKMMKVVEAASHVVIMIVAFLAMLWGGELAGSSSHLSPALRIPYSVVYASLPTGMGLVVFFGICKFVEKIFVREKT